MPARKSNPRPPKRSPLQQAPTITCPSCHDNVAARNVTYGQPVSTGVILICQCGERLQCIEIRTSVLWAWEVLR